MPFGGWVIASSHLATVAPDNRYEFGVKRQGGEEAREPTGFLLRCLVFSAFVKSVDFDHRYLLTLVLPQEPLVIPEVQASVRVGTLEDFQRNTFKRVRWGQRLVLVIRSEAGEVTAVEGRSPADGCVLQWDPKLARIHSPCSYQIYNPYGFVVAGLDNRALRAYPVMERDNVISIGSGS